MIWGEMSIAEVKTQKILQSTLARRFPRPPPSKALSHCGTSTYGFYLLARRKVIEISRQAGRPALGVSIRSPYQSKGRRAGRLDDLHSVFQSAPLTKARGDGPAGWTGRQGSFNPLPLPKQGETGRQARAGWTVSIRSPYQSKGRHGQAGWQAGRAVSIRSPYQSKGRRAGRLDGQAGQFQSAPLTKARGDGQAGWTGRQGSFNPLPLPKQGETGRQAGRAGRAVSIRSPYQSKGRRACRLDGQAGQFQSAPLTKARGDGPAGWTGRQGSFNPLPLPKQGETGLQAGRAGRAVSIRSPYQSKGRRAGRLDDLHSVFQSAPLTKARGDGQAGWTGRQAGLKIRQQKYPISIEIGYFCPYCLTSRENFNQEILPQTPSRFLKKRNLKLSLRAPLNARNHATHVAPLSLALPVTPSLHSRGSPLQHNDAKGMQHIRETASGSLSPLRDVGRRATSSGIDGLRLRATRMNDRDHRLNPPSGRIH